MLFMAQLGGRHCKSLLDELPLHDDTKDHAFSISPADL